MKYYKWTLQIEVADTWIADGFDFNEDRIQNLEETLVPYSYEGEVKIKVIKAPKPEAISKEQGY